MAEPFSNADEPAAAGGAGDPLAQRPRSFRDGTDRPFLHLVDGGVSDNVGMRAVLDSLQVFEALHEAGVPSPLDGGAGSSSSLSIRCPRRRPTGTVRRVRPAPCPCCW